MALMLSYRSVNWRIVDNLIDNPSRKRRTCRCQLTILNSQFTIKSDYFVQIFLFIAEFPTTPQYAQQHFEPASPDYIPLPKVR
jgi:hypothetical protein